MTRHKMAFGALILAQAAHSVEEYAGRLWETFLPARLLTAAVAEPLAVDQGQAFLLLNVALVAFGVWCFVWPIRRDWPSAGMFAWLWVTVEMINGIGHPFWALRSGGYVAGVATAPILLVIALYLGRQLLERRPSAAS